MLKNSISVFAFSVAMLAQAQAHAEDRRPLPSGPGAENDPVVTQPVAEPQEEPASDIIVTGTRVSGMTVADSPVPVQILSSEALDRTGSPDLLQSLAQSLPSIQAQAFGGDLQAHNLQMKLRGLSPNHTLILLNGKRRHGTANVSVAGGPYGGSAAPDMSFILPDSIDHIEVLQDGAAAQYGTDAIAGVINIIQKKADHGGMVGLNIGQHFRNDGDSYTVSGNIGVAPFEGAYLNVTAEKKFKDFTFRGDINPQVFGNNPNANTYLTRYPGIRTLPYYPYTNRISGNPEIHQSSIMYNAGYEFGDFEIYSFGSYGHKLARAYENTRTPDVIVRNGVPLYPAGFQPLERVEETDYAFTGGFKGSIGDTSFDLASTYGRDFVGVYVENSGNAGLYAATGFTPSFFHNGDFIATQWTNTLDVTHDFEMGLAEPVHVAAGLEFRHETYEIAAGDPASYTYNGSQSFFGYSPNNASKNSRDNFSQYLDITLKPIDGWLIDGAVRHEHYSDFGDTTVFKLTSRYDISDAFAIRGTASTGFRAPTLGEGFYSGFNVGPGFIGGVFPANDPALASLGFGALKPEKSTNLSAGFVFNPAPGLTMTLDAYWIKIRDRIVISGSFSGFSGRYCPQNYVPVSNLDNRCFAYNEANYRWYNQPVVLNAVTNALGGTPPVYVLYNASDPALGRNMDGSIGMQTFVNGVKMRTQGIDFMTTYDSGFFNLGKVNWSLSVNYNDNKVQSVAALPSAFYVHPDPSISNLLSRYNISTLEDSTPKVRATFGAFFTSGDFSLNFRESYYSKVKSLGTDYFGADFYTEVKGAFLTDLSLSYKFAEPLTITIGADNLFNKFPTETSWDRIRGPQLAAGSRTFSTNKYPTISPYGINGGYYYARTTIKF